MAGYLVEWPATYACIDSVLSKAGASDKLSVLRGSCKLQD